MTTQINQLTELTTTSDGDLLLIRENATGVDKKMQAVNLRAKATTKDDVGLGNVDNVSAADLRDRSTHTGTQTLSTISDAGTMAAEDKSNVTGDVNFDSGTLFVDASADAVGIGTTSPESPFEVKGNGNALGPSFIEISDTYNSGFTWSGIDFTRTYDTGGDNQLAAYIRQARSGGSQNFGILFGTGNQGTVSERMRIDSSGHAIIPAGVTLGTSAGVYNAANTLDDYETGTFTPVLVGLTSSGTGTYSIQQGRYTKIGNAVSFVVNLVWSAHTGTGNMQLNGLPFTSLSVNNTTPVTVRPDSITLSANSYLICSVPTNTSSVQIAQTVIGTVSGQLVPIDTSGTLRISGVYYV